MASPTRRQLLGAATLAAISGCVGVGGSGDSTPTPEPEPEPDSEDRDGDGGNDGDGSTAGDGGSDGSTSNDGGDSGSNSNCDSSETTVGDTGGVWTYDSTLPLSMEPKELQKNAMSGGPPKDGIPSIDDPKFLNPGDVDFLNPSDPVFGVVRDGTAKAYPQKILAQHEIVNDELAGTNVAVSYCPLTGTVQGFERGDTTFGVSGRLINNNLVMYDRDTEAWWPQILATSITGPWNENPEIRSLPEFRLVWTTWSQWRKHSPETQVLSTETGFARNYQNDPYGSYNPRRGYYADSSSPMFPALSEDDRYEPKRVVMGARTTDGAVAFLKDAIRDKNVMAGSVGSDPVAAIYDPRLDTAYVYRNPDENTYELDGCRVAGPDGETYSPDSLPLDRIHTFDAMWFAWAGYYPDTSVYE